MKCMPSSNSCRVLHCSGQRCAATLKPFGTSKYPKKNYFAIKEYKTSWKKYYMILCCNHCLWYWTADSKRGMIKLPIITTQQNTGDFWATWLLAILQGLNFELVNYESAAALGLAKDSKVSSPEWYKLSNPGAQLFLFLFHLLGCTRPAWIYVN